MGVEVDRLESLALSSKHRVIFGILKRDNVPEPQLLREEDGSEKDLLCRKTQSEMKFRGKARVQYTSCAAYYMERDE